MENTYVMTSSTDTLKKTVSEYLTRIEDFEQVSGDKEKQDLQNYFTDSYNRLEKYYIKLRNSEEITTKDRNCIRMLIKYTEKYAMSENLLN